MVFQKGVPGVTKATVKKNLKSSSGEEAVTPLAGPEVAVALEALHTMFMKELANTANMEAFKNKKSAVDKKMMVKVAKEALNNHIPEPGSDSSENSQESESDDSGYSR
jgi:hypothetical protein